MTNQNNVQNFINLHTTMDAEIEMNPAFIIYMTRGVHISSGVPCTTIHLTTGATIDIWETPEQISKLQMDSVMAAIGSIGKATAKIMAEMVKELEDEEGYEYGD